MLRLSRLSFSLSLALLCYGVAVFAGGPCLTAMSETFGVPLGRLGLLFSVYSVGLMPSVLVHGYLSEVVGRRAILLGAILAMGSGCVLFGAVPALAGRAAFPLALATMVLLGYGGGGMEALSNILITDDNQPSPAFALNLSHAFFAIGAVLGPLVVSALLRARLPWQFVFYGAAALFAVLFLLLAPQRLPAASKEPFSPGAALALLRSRLLWLLLGVLALYVGAEIGLSAWVSPLMEKVLGARRETAGLSVSAFWALMVVGRIGVSPLSARFRPVPLILVLAAGSAAGTLGVALAPTAILCIVAAACSGLFMSGIFALVLVDASRHFPERLGAVFGLILAGVGVGSLIVPAIMGWIAESAGLRPAMLVPTGLMVVVAASYLARWSQ